MKRLIFLLLVTALVFNLFIFQKESLYEQNIANATTYIIYSNYYEPNIPACEVIKNGNGSLVLTTPGNAKKTYGAVSGIGGEALEYDKNNVNIKELFRVLRANIKTKYELNDGVVYNCYSKKFSSFLKDFNSKINLQIAVMNNKVIVGYPLILHSF